MERTITLGQGIELVIDEPTRRRLLLELADTSAEPEPPVTPDRLEPGHRMWDYHSGGDRHARPDYADGDDDLARALRRGLSPKASIFFEELLTDPGRLFESQHFLDTFPETFGSHNAVAGCLNGFTRHCERDQRSFPFYWWEGRDDTPTRYTVHPDVARVFIRVGV